MGISRHLGIGKRVVTLVLKKLGPEVVEQVCPVVEAPVFGVEGVQEDARLDLYVDLVDAVDSCIDASLERVWRLLKVLSWLTQYQTTLLVNRKAGWIRLEVTVAGRDYLVQSEHGHCLADVLWGAMEEIKKKIWEDLQGVRRQEAVLENALVSEDTPFIPSVDEDDGTCYL